MGNYTNNFFLKENNYEYIRKKRNKFLGIEFDRYFRENPEFIERIPQNAHIALLIEGDSKFNKWSSQLEIKQADKDQIIVYVTIKKMSPPQSRIRELKLMNE